MSRASWIALLVLVLGGATFALVAGGARRDDPVPQGGSAVQVAGADGPMRSVAYGADPLQLVDVWPAPVGARPAPLVLFVHGGGWKRGSKDNATGSAKIGHLHDQGYAFASVNYRLVPTATVEQQAEDVAASMRAVLDRADELGLDRHRVVLMGHSAGAHLVALVGTDERFLVGAGLSFADVAGVIPIDGAAYDVTRQLQIGAPRMEETYSQAFGADLERQRALSPTLQAAPPNAARFLLLHVQRPDGVEQAAALAAALREAGTTVEVGSFPGTGMLGHMVINRRLGEPDYPVTTTVDRWLKDTFAP